MQRKHNTQIILLFISIALVVPACSNVSPPATPTHTPQPSSTHTLVPTVTFTPTRTPRPTATLNLTATQRYDEMHAIVQDFREKGYVASTSGRYVELDDFSQTMAEINYYNWWPTGKIATSFIFSAHFYWSTATKTPDVSGCGVVFALQEDGDHFAVFLDKSLLRVLQSKGGRSRRLGKTSGIDAFKFDNPDDADFTLAVNKNQAYVFVDDYKVIVYSLAQNMLMNGELGLGIRSGTNKSYGTACRMTDIRIWIAD